MDRDLYYKTKKYNRALYMVLIIVFLLLISSTYLDIKSKNEYIKEHLKTLENNTIDEYKLRLKESLHNTLFYIDNLYEFYLKKQNDNSKKLNETNYKLFEQDVREHLYKSIYEKVRYTWINKIENYKGGDNYAIRLIHPNLKNSEGSYLSTKTKDIEGNMPYLDELNGINYNKEVFYTYYFKEYGTNIITQKLSFAKLYKRLDWIIVTGIPLNILNKKTNLHKKILDKELKQYFTLIIIIKSLVLLILIFAVYFLKSKTARYLFENLNESYNKLKYSNERLFIATQSAHIGVWKWDIQKNLLEWNEEMYNIYEVNPKETKNTYTLWSNALLEDDKKDAEDKLNEAVKNYTLFSTTFKIKTKKGIKHILATGKTIYNKNNLPLYMIGTNKDITLEKNQEELIQKQSDSISKHVIYSRTNLAGIITDASDAFCKISGYTKEELIGKPHNIVRHEDMPKKLFVDMWEKLKQKQNWQGEIKNRKKDGSYYWVYADISPEYDNNKLIGFIAIRSDITINKELEEKQNQFIEQSKMASLGEMLGNIAHQWRQPLSIITTASTGIKLQKEAGILNDELLFEELDNINDTAQYLSETINTFRDFIKEEKVYKEIILQDRIKEVLKLLKATLKNNHIQLINNTEKINPIKVHIVIGELSQVIINIINNSKDAFKEKAILNPKITIGLKEFSDKVIITIEDNAGGINENVISKVFEPYFTTKHKSQGTGLGLYMSHKIITESLKGKIYVKNIEHGVRFYIELPLKQNY